MTDDDLIRSLDAQLAATDLDESVRERLEAARAALTEPLPDDHWTGKVSDEEIIGAILDRAPILPRHVAPVLGRGNCRTREPRQRR